MKKLVLIAVLGLLYVSPMKAQDIFDQVVNSAKLVIDDPQADPFILAVSRFKFSALQYICTTAIKQNGGSVRGDFLDEQAYSLNHFIVSYFSDLSKAQKKNSNVQKEIMLQYWKASSENPMFSNQDHEITDAYINAPDCITPFSLNTNWVKADKAIGKK